MAKIVTDKNFKELVLGSDKPVLVDFWASWCPPCKMTESIIKEAAQDLEGKVEVFKINVDQNPQSRTQFNIMGVPAFVLFKDGKELARKVGAQSKKQLMSMIEENLEDRR
jgi:thioredoxin 1